MRGTATASRRRDGGNSVRWTTGTHDANGPAETAPGTGRSPVNKWLPAGRPRRRRLPWPNRCRFQPDSMAAQRENRRIRDDRGFTLLELLVVIAILGLL